MNRVRAIEFASYGVTNVHPITMVLMAFMTVLVFSRQRSSAVLAVLAVCVFVPMEQRVIIGGLDFSMLRLILVAAWIRVFAKGEYRGFQFTKLDKLFALWVISGSFFYVLRIGPGGIVYRLGVAFDWLTAFFLIRMLVQTRTQVFLLWRHLAWIVILLSPFLLYESISEYNVFGIFDYAGVEYVEVRDGKARAQGPLSHPILAGTLGAVVIPVFMGLYLGLKKQRLLFGAACIGSIILVMAAGSSGAILATAVGVFGWAIWRYRQHMRLMLWSAVGVAVVIHFVREKPVWHLILRMEAFMGGTGSHRYYLIDAFIRRFGEWALMGTSNTRNWGWGLQDTTNQYVAEGVRGGLLTLVLFVLILKTSFVQLRLARRVFERVDGPESVWALLAWGSSVALTVHCVSFISVSYFGQMNHFLAIFIATVPAFAKFKRPKQVKSRVAQSRSARAPAPIPTAGVRSG